MVLLLYIESNVLYMNAWRTAKALVPLICDEDELEEIIIDVVDMTVRVLMGLVVLQDLMRKIQKAGFLSSKVEILIKDVGTTQIPINHI